MFIYPASARFQFGDGCAGDARFASEITVGIGGTEGSLAAFVLDADAPDFSRKGALEAVGRQPDFPQDTVALGVHGMEIPLLAHNTGRYTLSVKASCPAGDEDWRNWLFVRAVGRLAT